jgi:hypothetical protein
MLTTIRSLALREEHRPRVFENRVLRKIFGPKRDEVIGGWRELHNEELRDLYSSPSIVKLTNSVALVRERTIPTERPPLRIINSRKMR